MVVLLVVVCDIQYKRHNIKDWIENKSNQQHKLHGFRSEGGSERVTNGILMWSDIFTHDYDNGDKIAIILMDTQGVFDTKSSIRDCITIFALSTLLSSVQCYNLKGNIQEDHFQHLALFTEYAKLAFTASKEKPFQHLLFIVRDWQNEFEHAYGFYEQSELNILTENDEYTQEKKKLRNRIKSSFDEISVFLMPHPGFIVHKENYAGDLKDIEPDFIKCLQDHVPSLLSPENLVAKKIDGQRVRACDFIQYLQAYVNLFNGNEIPEPISILEVRISLLISIEFNDEQIMFKYVFRTYMLLK